MAKFIQPYNFVPVKFQNIAKNRKTPVTHEVFPKQETENKEQFYSGRFQCSAWAVTPVIIGNEQISYKDLQEQDKQAASIIQSEAHNHHQKPHNEHTIIKPFKFPDDTYGISDSTLKGMVANVYAAFTDSPMERVNDRKFSFRPNLNFGAKGVTDYPHPKAGLYLGNGKVLVFNVGRDNFKRDRRPTSPSGYKWLPDSAAATYKDILTLLDRWVQADKKNNINTNINFEIAAGLDGNGIFADSFKTDSSRRLKYSIQLPLNVLESACSSGIYDLAENIIERFEMTKTFLYKDHLKYYPAGALDRDKINKIKKAVCKLTLKPGKLIFLEMYNDTIISFGMNFRYRWLYNNTIETIYNESNGKNEIRDIFNLSDETDKDFKDLKLSPRRRLFGFVNKSFKKKDKVNAMAGRVKFSYARHIEGTGGEKKFVPLKELGSPSATSYENYLVQDGRDKTLKDYGEAGNPGASGELRGRKFYLHNPAAAWEESVYKMEGNNIYDKRNSTAEVLLVPDPSKEGKNVFPEFRFTVCFENLDESELSNLYFSLCLASNEKNVDMITQAGKAVKGQDHLKQLKEHPLYNNSARGHKLGAGKPFGLGSLIVNIDTMQMLKINKDDLPVLSDEYPELNPPELSSPVWKITCIRQPDNDAEISISYAKAWNRGQEEIFHFHSNIRQQQAQARRGKTISGEKVKVLKYELPKIDDIFENPVEP